MNTIKFLFFSSKWRIWRWDYLLASAILAIPVIWVQFFLLSNPNLLENIWQFTSIFFLSWIVGMFFVVNLIIKRLHDLGEKWTNIFYLLIPFVNIFYFFNIMLWKWTDWPNEFWDQESVFKLNKSSYIALGVTGMLLLWGFSYFIFQSITGIIMSHPAILDAKNITINDQRVKDIYGSNIVFGVWNVNIQENQLSGNANLDLPFEWNNLHWRMTETAVKVNWVWVITNLSVKNGTNDIFLTWNTIQ